MPALKISVRTIYALGGGLQCAVTTDADGVPRAVEMLGDDPGGDGPEVELTIQASDLERLAGLVSSVRKEASRYVGLCSRHGYAIGGACARCSEEQADAEPSAPATGAA